MSTKPALVKASPTIANCGVSRITRLKNRQFGIVQKSDNVICWVIVIIVVQSYLNNGEYQMSSYSIGKRWEIFITDAVKDGRYANKSEVLREGLRMVEERETKLVALRNTLDAAITKGGDNTTDDVIAASDKALDAWENEREK